MKFFAKATAKRGEMYLYDEIGGGFFSEGITASSVQEALATMKGLDGVDVYINSPGGAVFEGVTIYNQLKRFAGQKTVHIDGLAASIASIIAMAGDEICMAENAMMMIHDPYGFAMGTSDDMRKQADAMDQVRGTLVNTYVARTKGDEKAISGWMAAETWMDAKQSVERGFADKITADRTVEASVGGMKLLAKYRNAPERFMKPQAATPLHAKLAHMDMATRRLREQVPGAGPHKA